MAGVPKIAVIALVLIFACPILLGYAFNLTETVETGYRETGEAVNVTPLISTGTGYTYTHADLYQINSKFALANYTSIIPIYESFSSNKSSMPAAMLTWNGNFYPPNTYTFTNYTTYYWQFDYDYNVGHINASVALSGGGSSLIQYVHTLMYNYTTGILEATYYVYGGGVAAQTINNAASVTFSVTAGYTAQTYEIYNLKNNNSSYVDFASGFHFTGNISDWWIKVPDNSASILFTMDLNSITDSSYTINLTGVGGGYTLEKSTTAGVVSWLLRSLDDPTDTIDLYYDNNRSSNTYQVYWDLLKSSEDGTNIYYNSHREFRYVGDWPTMIGEANVYLTFTDDRTTSAPVATPLNFNSFAWGASTNNRSPTIRVDDAYFRAFEYPAITDYTFNPASFRNNPATTLSGIIKYGTSFTFGGNTYTVNRDGNITLGSHSIPISNLVLSSIPSPNGGYDNKIGNTIVSTTSQPSTITFNGEWSASISIKTMESYNYTHTEWNVGKFGWDGIDTNFLMVGLITCLGVFIALGIYARKSGSGGIIPLMIAVGCAAAVFFIML